MSLMDIQEVISSLKTLDLNKNPETQVRGLLSNIGRIGFISTILHPGYTIVRARPNEQGKVFNTRADLSYKPPHKNTTYQRASTPNQTMFYGGVIPPGDGGDISSNSRYSAAFESSYLLREDKDGIQTLTFSKWEVLQDIPVITICYHEDYLARHPHSASLNIAYQEWLKGIPSHVADPSMHFTTYLASEFSKKVSSREADYNYMISAIFSELSLGEINKGIYYPGVQTKGTGFNVAITPNAVDSCLRLVGASECTIYKKAKNILIDNESICSINDDSKPFLLKPIESRFRFGKEESKKRVGL